MLNILAIMIDRSEKREKFCLENMNMKLGGRGTPYRGGACLTVTREVLIKGLRLSLKHYSKREAERREAEGASAD